MFSDMQFKNTTFIYNIFDIRKYNIEDILTKFERVMYKITNSYIIQEHEIYDIICGRYKVLVDDLTITLDFNGKAMLIEIFCQDKFNPKQFAELFVEEFGIVIDELQMNIKVHKKMPVQHIKFNLVVSE